MNRTGYFPYLVLLFAVVVVVGALSTSPHPMVAEGSKDRPAETTAAGGLSSLYQITEGVSDASVAYHRLDVRKGQEVVLADLKGPGKITCWYITDDAGGNFYPGLVLKVFWDEATEPAINVPLGDFFGALAGKTIDYQSAVMQIVHRCFLCRLPMPFSKRARFLLVNDGDRDYSQSVAYGIDYEKDRQYAQQESRLHCSWRRSNPTREGVHTILSVKGRGHYVGSFLHVQSRFQDWWGEGDTIFSIDGKAVTHSPGTEDEYGVCWFPDFGYTYSGPYGGYLQNERKGQSRMYRWYLPDPIRFQKSLTVQIQNQHENGTPTTAADADDYTSVAYWYQIRTPSGVTLQSFRDRTAQKRQ